MAHPAINNIAPIRSGVPVRTRRTKRSGKANDIDAEEHPLASALIVEAPRIDERSQAAL